MKLSDENSTHQSNISNLNISNEHAFPCSKTRFTYETNTYERNLDIQYDHLKNNTQTKTLRK